MVAVRFIQILRSGMVKDDEYYNNLFMKAKDINIYMKVY